MGLMYTNTLSYDMHGRKRKAKKAKGEVYGKYKPTFKTLQTRPAPPRRDEGVVYKSADEWSMSGSTARKEPQKYTGTLIKGIATMHKSNAVPVIDQQHAEDISRMRR